MVTIDFELVEEEDPHGKKRKKVPAINQIKFTSKISFVIQISRKF